MINHLIVGSSDIERSRRFYNTVLGVLGAGVPRENQNATGQTRLFCSHDGSTFSVSEPINGEPVVPSNGSNIGFVCDSPEQLQEFHDAAVSAGGTSVEDPPGPRESASGVMSVFTHIEPFRFRRKGATWFSA